jgi:hypothetical protein
MEMKTRIVQILIITILLTFGFTSAPAQKRVAPKKLREVKIYLVKATEEYDPKNPANLFPVKRKVDAASPLRSALEALMRGETKQEEKRGLYAATFGIQFVSVKLENGMALARFTMPETASFSGTNSPIYFIESVEKTALQFPLVKKVVVCLDGIIDFWREDDTPPKKC